MPQEPRISVIMPVYNAGAYLPLAVRSVLAQTFPDLELLLVDDGSTDGSGEACEALAQTDARIRVFRKANGGAASARNLGLKNARGAYVGFADSDDLLHPEMYARLYAAITPGVRMAACGAVRIDENGRPAEAAPVSLQRYGVRDAQEMLLEAFEYGGFYGPLSWNKLFDIRLFREKGLFYDETMHYGEDASILHLVFEGERCHCLPDALYYYRIHAGQLTSDAFVPHKLDNLRMYWQWRSYFAARPLYARWAGAAYWRLYYQLWCQAGQSNCLRTAKPYFKPYKKHLSALLPELLRGDILPPGEKLRALLFCAEPSLMYTAARTWGALVAWRK